MSDELKGKKIAFLLANSGVEQAELSTPWQKISADDFDALVLPGADWVDEESVTCPMQGFTLVTSRNPDDLDAFTSAATAAFAKA